MKEKDLDQKTTQEEIKLQWEIPILISLNKGKTEGGEIQDTYEDTFIDVHS